MSDRDELLGAALRALPVPAHRPGFRLEGRFPTWPLTSALAVAAVVVAAALLVVSARPQTASAADVRRAVAAAMAAPHSFSARIHTVDRIDGSTFQTLVVAADGSYLVRGKTLYTAYDAQTGSVTSSFFAAGPNAVPRGRVYEIWRNVDPAMFAFALDKQGFGAGVNAILGMRNARVSDTTFESRPAWRVELRQTNADPSFYGNGERVVLIVDRETGFVVSIARYLTAQAQPTSTVRLEALVVDGPTPRSLFVVRRQAGSKVLRADWGFRRATRSAVTLLPTDTRGLPLSTIATAEVSGAGVPHLQDLPERDIRRNVASAVYGNGFAASIAFTTRNWSEAEGMPPAADLANTRAVQLATPHRVHLTQGSFAGLDAWVSAAPLQNTYLWAGRGGIVVRIESTLPESDVIAVANSLAPA
jgi:hypothetical protein